MTTGAGSAPVEIYAITPGSARTGHDVAAQARAALDAGVDLLQIREKGLATRALLPLARALARASGGGRVLVNDRVDVAWAAGCAGVHLATSSLPVAKARRVAPGLRLGVSTHSLAEARAAERAGADLVVFGPVFPTPSKARFGPPLGVEALLEVTAALAIPVFALGGIRWSNLPTLLAAGVRRIAAISLVFGDGDPAAAVRNVRRLAAAPTRRR